MSADQNYNPGSAYDENHAMDCSKAMVLCKMGRDNNVHTLETIKSSTLFTIQAQN